MPTTHAAVCGKKLIVNGKAAAFDSHKQAMRVLEMIATAIADPDALHLVLMRKRRGNGQFWHRLGSNQVVCVVGPHKQALLRTTSVSELQEHLPTIWQAIKAAHAQLAESQKDETPSDAADKAEPEEVPPARVFGTVSGRHLCVERFERDYALPGSARNALMLMAAAAADASLDETASRHDWNDGDRSLSIVARGQDVFVLPFRKRDPLQPAECRQMTWPRFHLEHPEAAAALERAMRRHHEEHPDEIVPDHVMALYPKSADPAHQPAPGAQPC